ncbi:lipid-A-disaccharide synthase [bacterium]|nr:lipid-A-disaccharide synthase [bacterium]
MKKRLKIFIIAGEVSGDVLGAKIMREMPDADFVGVGGENMASAGLKSLFPISDIAVMGVAEVLAHARTLTRRMRQTADAILAARPDIVLTIDAPGFARGVVSRVRGGAAGRDLIARGMTFQHVVAPQVWAWRPGRAKKYAATFDRLFSFFEFERPYFTKYGLDTVAVGHPIADGLTKYRRPAAVKDADRTIALIPGSRLSEVKKLLPLMRNTVDMLRAAGYTHYHYVMPTVETTADYIRAQTQNWAVHPTLVPSDARYDLYRRAYMAIAASGTVSVELAILHVPTIVVYKMNPITMWLARRVIRIKWVSLVNILMNRCVYPELLGADANAANVVDWVGRLALPAVRRAMMADLTAADALWRGDAPAAARIADALRQKILPR